MKINELSRLSGVNAETIRLYRKKGLLHPIRLPNGYFDYSLYNFHELLFIRKLRGSNLGLDAISYFYSDNLHSQLLQTMQDEVASIDATILALERQREILTSTLEHYQMFPSHQKRVVELTAVSDCYSLPLECTFPEREGQEWLKHADFFAQSLSIDPTVFESPVIRPSVPYTLRLNSYAEIIAQLGLSIPPQAVLIPKGRYLSIWLEAKEDGTLDGSQLQPLVDYAALHHYRLCKEQGSFLYRLKSTKDGLRLLFRFRIHVLSEEDISAPTTF